MYVFDSPSVPGWSAGRGMVRARTLAGQERAVVTRTDATETAARLPATVVLVGPTAVGKSRLALHLAQEFGADILTADSRQVYRYMDIGTAKPSRAEQAAVRHYMLDLVAPDEGYSAERFRREGLGVLRRIAAEGRVAIVAGGTGFYLRALLDGPAVATAPPDPSIRARLQAELADHGPDALHQRLSALDPASAHRVHPHNIPRLIRALEVVEQTGGPVPPIPAGTSVPALYLGLRMDRNMLWEVANRRVIAQFEAGLAAETAALLAMGYTADMPPLGGFAYRQTLDYLGGRLSRSQAIAEYQLATRQYIRRQMTWFRRDHRITWLESESTAFRRAHQLISSYLTTAASDVPASLTGEE